MDFSKPEPVYVQPKLEQMDSSNLEPPALKTKATEVACKAYRSSDNRAGSAAASAEGESSSDGNEAPAVYTEAETEVLARCWADVNQDSVVGNTQKDSYWTRILQRYRANRPDKTPKRNIQKLRTRWDRVKNLLAEFQQLCNECEMQYRSGESEADTSARALNQWQNMKGAPFKHFETWRIVKDTPKFAKVFSAKYQIQAPTKRTKTREDGSYTASASESTPSMGTPQSGNESSSRLKQPMGRDAAKAVARGKKKVGSFDIASQLDAATATMQEAVDAFNIATGYSIVMRNTSDMSPEKKAFHEAYVAMLKKKHGWNF